MFTKHLPDSLLIDFELTKQVSHIEKTWKERGKEPVKASANATLNNVRKNGYLQYGMYWWAVKKILIKLDLIHGDNIDEVIASVYKGNTDLETLVLAYEFSQFYNSHYFQGTFQFPVNATDVYTLFDEEAVIH